MTDIIELLFDNECENECGYHVKKEELEKDEEYQAYQKVCALLNEEGREIFDRFEELYSERYSEKRKDITGWVLKRVFPLRLNFCAHGINDRAFFVCVEHKEWAAVCRRIVFRSFVIVLMFIFGFE